MIDGGSPQNLVANIINVGDLGPSIVKDVHVFDASGVDESISGQLVIQGSADPSAVLRVKVVDRLDTASFVQAPGFELTVGLRDFGGIRFENPANPADTSLRDRAVVAVAVAGDVTGDIDAAQVWRIDALMYEASPGVAAGGRILGTITTHREGDSVVGTGGATASAIAYVRGQ